VFSISVNAQNTTLEKLVANVSEASLKTNLYKIAGKEFEGRMTASKGDSLATRFIANWFNTYHLNKPYKTTTPYLQNVPLGHSDYSTSSFSVDGKFFELNQQWTYTEGCNAAQFKNVEVVFIGYGISVPRFDEFKDMDIAGKFVMLQFGFPTDSNGKCLIPEKEMPDEDQQSGNIDNKKPAGVLVYVPDFKDEMNEINNIRNFQPYHIYTKREIPPLNSYLISPDITNYLVGNIDSINNLMNTSGKPHSFNTDKKVIISIHKNEEKVNTDNIVGILIGSNEKLPCIVVTAHHDHFGKINGSTYYGADDNGSGTTALLEIVKILGNAAKQGIRPKRTIVFVSTGAEEQGLYGSRYYVEHPVIPLSKTYCNLNIDMLGRVDSFYAGKKADSNYVYCLYRDTTNKIFNSKKLNSISQTYSRLTLDTLYTRRNKSLNPYSLIARSDNFPFMQKGIPAVWFFSGFHKDYHQPGDTPEKINFPLFKRRTQFVLATLCQLANEQ
jgi:Peptidase family M28